MFSWWLMAALECFFLHIPVNLSPHLASTHALMTLLVFIVWELYAEVMTQHPYTCWASLLGISIFFYTYPCILCTIGCFFTVSFYKKLTFLFPFYVIMVWKIIACFLHFSSSWLVCMVMDVRIFCLFLVFCYFYIITF